MMGFRAKRVYDSRTRSDGVRILVDRLWPRGLRKEQAAIDEWTKSLAPSQALRLWFAHRPERWTAFRSKYLRELRDSEKQEDLRRLRALGRRRNVTLLYAARDDRRNNAQVLLQALGGRSTGVRGGETNDRAHQ